MTNAAAGWYDQGNGTQRYWDGNAWTDHIAPSAAPAAPATPPPPAAPATPPPPPAPATPPPPPPAPAAPEPPAAPAAEIPPPPAPAAAPVEIPPPPTAPPAPAYAAQASYTPVSAPKKRKVWPWVLGIVGGLGVIVIGIIVLVVVLFANAVGAPADAVKKFDEAWAEADCDKLDATTTDNYQTNAGWFDCETFQANAESVGGSTSFRIVSTEVVNDTATVTTEEAYPGDTTVYEFTYHLIKEDGAWKIDSADYSG